MQRRKEPRPLLSTLNPEAGAHPITTDPEELAAATAAGERSIAEFPYYEVRYGERGHRFAVSDSAWLVTLGRMRTSDAMRQVLWLGQVLSARGMPQYLLERHLLFLDEALEPLRRADSRRVHLHAARRMAAARQAVIGQQTFDRLAAEFDRAAANIPRHVPRMGAILVSAVADQKMGLANSVTSVVTWACDESRFPAAWCAAVNDVIQRAKSAR